MARLPLQIRKTLQAPTLNRPASPIRLQAVCAGAVCLALTSYIAKYLRDNSRIARYPRVVEVRASLEWSSTLLCMQLATAQDVPMRSAAADVKPLLTRRVFDCHNGSDRLKRLVRKEGVTQNEAGQKYQGQSGALNRYMSDVYGVLWRQ